MALPLYKPVDPQMQRMQTQWKAQLDPVIALPPNAGVFLNGPQNLGLPLVSGVNNIDHGLGRDWQGWVVVDIDTASINIYRVTNTTPNLILTLHASGACNIKLWVF